MRRLRLPERATAVALLLVLHAALSVRVPCTGIALLVLAGPGAQKQVTIRVADPLCLLNGLWNGFQPQSK